MTQDSKTGIAGLVGFRPKATHANEVACPPYDVIKPGTALEKELFGRSNSLVHITLGAEPKAALDRLVQNGILEEDNEPSFYVYEQSWNDHTGTARKRVGILVALEVTDYSEGRVIRHEKTFDDKVKGRVALAEAIEHTVGPVFLLSKAKIEEHLQEALLGSPTYDFTSEFGPGSDLSGIRSRIFRVTEASELGQKIQSEIGKHPVYIADGHHRYHAALRNNLTHQLAYITAEAKIEAYNRVVKGTVTFQDAKKNLDLQPIDSFQTPPKHAFALYHQGKSYLLNAKEIPEDVVGGLDCSILERELYPLLGLSHSMIMESKHFDYYPESQLDKMQEVVDQGTYDLAIALHPVNIGELMAVADAGLSNSSIVMPEKSTFFAPKILSGIFLYRHSKKVE